ncbi:hypothetical protein MLGJGCBP_01529 [Rhodococcus sp. T7]|nr:hypothetical protein MLGJGCBP_10109 [Rhodococcus sp. T7]KAF0965327.1 hypothetical protein MLGJGCBP_01529 [Rhodococcus sp. T7]
MDRSESPAYGNYSAQAITSLTRLDRSFSLGYVPVLWPTLPISLVSHSDQEPVPTPSQHRPNAVPTSRLLDLRAYPWCSSQLTGRPFTPRESREKGVSVDFDTELLSLGRAEADQLGAVRTVRNILRLRRQRTSNEQCHRALSTDHVRVGVHNDAVADADENTAGDADGKLHPAQMSAPLVGHKFSLSGDDERIRIARTARSPRVRSPRCRSRAGSRAGTPTPHAAWTPRRCGRRICQR